MALTDGAELPAQINPSLLRPEEKETKYVQVIAQFGQFQEIKQVSKVSFLSGYIFIQTDKPVYNPGDTGKGIPPGLASL